MFLKGLVAAAMLLAEDITYTMEPSAASHNGCEYSGEADSHTLAGFIECMSGKSQALEDFTIYMTTTVQVNFISQAQGHLRLTNTYVESTSFDKLTLPITGQCTNVEVAIGDTTLPITKSYSDDSNHWMIEFNADKAINQDDSWLGVKVAGCSVIDANEAKITYRYHHTPQGTRKPTESGVSGIWNSGHFIALGIGMLLLAL